MIHHPIVKRAGYQKNNDICSLWWT